jgi:hypothetical protein
MLIPNFSFWLPAITSLHSFYGFHFIILLLIFQSSGHLTFSWILYPC